MASSARLKELFAMAGIDMQDKYNLAEITAYCKGLDMVESVLSGIDVMTACVINDYPTRRDFDTQKGTTAFVTNKKTVTFTDFEADTVGRYVEKWVFPNFGINLGGDGLSWEEMESFSRSFREIGELKYRWDMIESR